MRLDAPTRVLLAAQDALVAHGVAVAAAGEPNVVARWHPGRRPGWDVLVRVGDGHVTSAWLELEQGTAGSVAGDGPGARLARFLLTELVVDHEVLRRRTRRAVAARPSGWAPATYRRATSTRSKRWSVPPA